MYRSQERKRQREMREAAAGMPAVVGGMIASKEGAKLYVEEFQRLTAAIDRLSEAFNRVATSTQDSDGR